MKLKNIKSKTELSDKDNLDGYLIDADEKMARRIVESLKQKKFAGVIAVLGRSGGFNRRAVETLKINYLVSPELGDRKDSLKQRDSGLNHVVAKAAKTRGVEIVINFDSLSEMGEKAKALRLARIIQNVKICRKAGCGIKIWGVVDEKSLKSFGEGLGMSSGQVSKCCNL
jgi:RNase P/RNase MRP subunit p30